MGVGGCGGGLGVGGWTCGCVGVIRGMVTRVVQTVRRGWSADPVIDNSLVALISHSVCL